MYGDMQRYRGQRGASVVLWTLSLLPIFGLAALAVDVSNLFVASAELGNAADAGALEGATHLYNTEGTMIQRGTVVAEATDAATANLARGTAVEVASVQIGHWRFDPDGGGQFTSTDSDTPVDLVGKVLFDPGDPDSCDNLNNACSGEINAVRVVTERRATPVQAFFARVLGIDNFPVAAQAVAYVGYAGSLGPAEVDEPIAICQDAILDPENDSYSCSVGHFIDDSQTARWTDFSQVKACQGSADTGDMQQIICSGEGNTDQIVFSREMSTTNGQAQGPIFEYLYGCWKNPGHCEELDPKKKYCGIYKNQTAADAAPVPTEAWHMVLPVVQCEFGPESCKKVVGAVGVNVLYIVDKANDINAEAPKDMTLPIGPGGQPVVFHSDDPSGTVRWNLFVQTFNLKDSQGNPAAWQQKTVYFAPDCDVQEPRGLTAGRNFGIRAVVPVLVD